MSWLAQPENSSNGRNRSADPGDNTTRLADTKSKLRILIVEDEFLIAVELENRLLDAGFEVVGIAATADEAITLAGSENPSLAITDIRLAGRRDGVDTALELFNKFRIRSIFSSAHAGDPDVQRRAATALPIGWLQKPYSATVLIRLINAYLAGLPSAL